MQNVQALDGAGRVQRFGHHQNAFGAIRLLLAALVIVAHTPELMDGDRHREILTVLFGTVTFGELAVNGFFLVSGYLITASFLTSRTPGSYLLKRVARIFPAYLVAFLICVLVVAPIGGATLPTTVGEYVSIVVQALLLQPPKVGHVFEGTIYPLLNGAMWTIGFEFKCYLLVVVLGVAGVFRRPALVVVLASMFLTLAGLFPLKVLPFDPTSFSERIPDLTSRWDWIDLVVGSKASTVRLVGIFLTGASFYLYRDRLRFTPGTVALALVSFVTCLFTIPTVTAGMAVFGGYLLLAVAFHAGSGWLSRVNNDNDVSYGLYLYAWPVTKLILWWLPSAPLLVVGILTFAASYMLGWASWLLIEKPVMRRVCPRQRLRAYGIPSRLAA